MWQRVDSNLVRPAKRRTRCIDNSQEQILVGVSRKEVEGERVGWHEIDILR